MTGPVASCTVEGNRVGTNGSGDSALANGHSGLYFGSGFGGGGHTIRGNVISGNEGPGLWISLDMVNTVVESNFIGTDDVGSAPVPNAESGIRVDGPTTANHMIRGNVVSGNLGPGVEVTGGPSGVTLQGNRMGTNEDGTAALANVGSGVRIDHSSSNLVGGDLPEHGNVISGNLGSGVVIVADGPGGAQNNTVRSNLVGTNAAGTAGVGNVNGGVAIGGAKRIRQHRPRQRRLGKRRTRGLHPRRCARQPNRRQHDRHQRQRHCQTLQCEQRRRPARAHITTRLGERGQR